MGSSWKEASFWKENGAARASPVVFLVGCLLLSPSYAGAIGNSPPQIVTGAASFEKQVIGTGLDETHSVVAADLTGNGEIDVVATDFVDDSVIWYENDGNGGFVPHLLDNNLGGAYPADVADVDGDGDTDVLAAGYEADTFVWYENDGVGGFSRHEIDTGSNGAHSIVTGDVDDDGDFDLVTSSQDANRIAWYENDGNESFTERVIDNTASGAKRAEVADIDGDGDMDVATASFFSDEITWYENDGNESFTKRVIDNTANGAYFVSLADIDGDDDLDLFSASQLDGTIAWYRNDGGAGFSAQSVDTGALGARSVVASDVNGDGRVDAVAASVDDDTVAWYENDGAGGFTKRVIDGAAAGAYGVFAIDMDRDGDVDVLSAIRDADAVALYTQIQAHTATIDPGDTLVITAALLRAEDVDDGPEDLTYTVTDAPDFGELRVGGAPLTSGGTFSQADIDNALLAYEHDGVDGTPDGFAFTVADGGEDGVRPPAGAFSLIILTPPIVHLPFEEGVGTLAGDGSGTGNNGTLLNGAAFDANAGDGSDFSVRFDGVDDHIDLGTLDVAGTGLTLAVWFNADSFLPTSDARLISKASGTAAADHVFMLSTVEVGSVMRLRARVRVGGSTTTLIASGGDLVAGAWHHAALSYEGTMLRLYLDGAEVGSTPLTGAVDMDPTLAVAVGGQPAGAGGRYFDGLIDDVRILERGMTASEIARIVAGQPDGVPSLSPQALAALTGVLLLVAATALRRRRWG